MIALNFTLFVQLCLFLLFLYVTNAIVVRPLLKTIDARNAKIEADQTAADGDAQEAARVERSEERRVGKV